MRCFRCGRKNLESGRARIEGILNNNVIAKEDEDENMIEIQQRALDDIVNVNSLFTMAVFVGRGFTVSGPKSLENTLSCNTDTKIAEKLIFYEVISFALFLLSSLTAKSLKVQLHLHRFKIRGWLMKYKFFRGIMLSLSFGSSLLGIVCLTLSMVNIIQISLGTLACGNANSIEAVATMCSIVVLGLAIYLPSSINVIWILVTTSQRKSSMD